ncbi:hypothetical protein [Shewanella livingstonensis]|uniref:Uncharacterized protein n=1 Tax=Shewanella livingstonensis TaxID=150120 RepID=A0A3G8LRQ6_9GAMM|nr:hypothetical protein [Shewanella livingstonensis]AZG72107.1 hypothetical protein EGC82_04620 [Shewanella livingstonensis]
MFNKLTGTLLITASSFSIVSAVEKIKWIFICFNLVYVVLAVSVFSFSAETVGRLMFSILLMLIAFSYQCRWCFDASRKVLTQFHGFKLGGKSIYSLQQQDVEYSIIKNIELKEVHNTYKVILHVKESEQAQLPEPISISLKVKLHKLPALVQQCRKELMSQGINVVGQFDSVSRKDWPTFSSVPLDQDTVKAFIGIKLFNDPIKLQYPVTLFMLPLPRQYFHQVWASSYISFMVALFILYSSQNIVAATVVALFGGVVSAVRRKLICDKHYTQGISSPNEIVISENSLVIPRVYFEDKQVRQIEKSAIKSINIEWNWYKAGDGDSTRRQYRRPFVFRVNIDVSNGESIVLAGQTFDSNQFVIALCQLGYSATLTQISKIAAVWRFYILIPIVVALLGMTGFGLYSLYIRYLV